MNPSEKTDRNQEANVLIDRMVIRQLNEMDESGEPLSASMLTALTQRFGKGDMSKQEQAELISQLRIVDGQAEDEETA